MVDTFILEDVGRWPVDDEKIRLFTQAFAAADPAGWGFTAEGTSGAAQLKTVLYFLQTILAHGWH